MKLSLFTRKAIYTIFCCSVFFVTVRVHAASLYMTAPKTASSNRAPVVVQVFLNTKGDTVSGVGGTFSYPSDLFSLQMISTQNGVVSLWTVQPHISLEKNLDGRTRVVFEGIMPGGFDGVRSPYYDGVHPGLLFTVSLIPLHAGEAEFLLDNTQINAFNADATLFISEDSSSHISIPELSSTIQPVVTTLSQVVSNTATALVERSPLVNNNAWYLTVHEDEVIHSIDHIEVAETREYDPDHVSRYQWHTVTLPYILQDQSLHNYIQIKIVYTNNTYATKTVAPVENSHTIFPISRILICIIIVGVLLARYAKNFFNIFLTFFRKRA